MRGLTPRQARFVEEYLVDLNATQAAKRAGYSPTSAKQVSVEVMSNPSVSRAVAERVADRNERLEMRQDAVVLELARLGFSNMADYIRFDTDGQPVVDLEKCSREQLACIQEITTETRRETGEDGERSADVIKVKVKLYDRRQALESLGKHLGLYLTRLADADGRALGSGLVDRLELARRAVYLLRFGKPPIDGEASAA